MPTLQEYFKNDFKDLSIDSMITVTIGGKNNITGEIIEDKVDVTQRLIQDSNSSIRFFTFYIPITPFVFQVSSSVIKDLDKWKEKANGVEVIAGFTGDKTLGSHSTLYSKRIYIYSESLLSEEEMVLLDEVAKEKNVFITFRSTNYLEEKTKTERPQAFISHDSRNKELIAKPLADGLNSRLCYVWYDDYSLKVGDSLRISIEKGIKEAKKCILILTPEFLNNPGWTKKEFDSIFTREMIFKEKIVLPIWYGVKKEEVYEYSPALADTVAVRWPNKNDFSEEEYKKEVQKVVSKIHTEVTTV